MNLSEFEEFTLNCMKEYKGSSNYYYKVFYNMPEMIQIFNVKKEQELILMEYCIEGWKLFTFYADKDKTILHHKLKTLRDTTDELLKKTLPGKYPSIRTVIDGYVLGDYYFENDYAQK
jgi:hypothetical protein